MRTLRSVGLIAAMLSALIGTGLSAGPASAATTPLIGTFSVTAGSCSGATASGTYLRMVLSGGTNGGGPYFSNSDSTCSDNSYTPLAPGTAGGLVSGSYEPEPSPAFDGSGNALAGQVTAPVAFEGVKFATSTNPVDPQTGLHVPVPTIDATGTSLSGNLEAFGVAWNNQQFNQGSPKPGGGTPGNTTPVTGTYNPATGAYTLQWSSQVVGGPFNGFSAFWNLTGTFTPSAPSSSSSGPSPAPAAGTAAGSTSTGSGHSASSAAGTAPAAGQAAGSAPSNSSTTTSTAPATPTAPKGTTKTRFVLTSHTVTSGGGGWNTPTWVIALLALLAALGLGGIGLTEVARRRQGESS